MTELIFVCGNLYPFNVGGAEVFNHYLMQELAQACKVSCLNSKTNKVESGINHIRIPNGPIPALFFPFFIAVLLVFRTDKQRLHVVLTFSRSRWVNWIYYPLLKRLFGVNYSIIVHGGGLTQWKFRAPFVRLFRSATHVIGISERICHEYENRTGVRVKFIPPLIPFQISKKSKQDVRQVLAIPTDAKLILQVGSLKQLKHPETVIEALANLGLAKLQELNLYVVFAGDGPRRELLHKLAATNGISSHVRFLGNVPREMIDDVYAASDIYVIASDFEGTPLSMLEAMANRLPVLASNAPGINTVITHNENGLLFTTGSGSELAQCLTQLLSDTELVHRLSTEALRTVQFRYDHGKMLEAYRNLWNL
jgi:glycosyltransferase involved in cell wall biosynthesis